MRLSQNAHKGLIVYDGVEIKTGYKMEGLTRFWFWENEEGRYVYLILLQGDVAEYFDYSGGIETKPAAQGWKCR